MCDSQCGFEYSVTRFLEGIQSNYARVFRILNSRNLNLLMLSSFCSHLVFQISDFPESKGKKEEK